MKIILASQGFMTAEIANAIAQLAGKPLDEINVAIINEAYVGISAGRDETWLINELSLIAQYIKGTISFVNLHAYDIDEVERRLEFADLIYIVGGLQSVLPKLFAETGFDKLIAKLANKKVIMGTSAGANVLGRQIEDPKYWIDQYGSAEEYLSVPTLGLVNFNILPHFEREDHPRRNAEVLTPLLSNNPFQVYGITDTQAVVSNEEQIQMIGGEVKIFGQKETNS